MADEEGSREGTLDGQGAEGVDLQGWSIRAEDLLDRGDEEGAVALLEKVVGGLQIRSDAGSHLGLAAALNDLGQIYASQGLSLKSDEVLNSALLIKHRRAQEAAEFGADSQPLVREHSGDEQSREGAQNVRAAEVSGSMSSTRGQGFQSSRDSPGEPSTAGAREEEEDWEAILDELPTPQKSFPQIVHKVLHSSEKSSSKQRGRGSFTYGGTGMYSDKIDLSVEDGAPDNSSSQFDHSVNQGASHVLVLSFSSKTKTKDLEDLVQPFSNKGGCSIRWIDDTRALAVFSSPAMAREALVGIKDARYKVDIYSESSEIYDDQPLVRDLAPPGPRPTSSPRVAQRMIASALSRPDILLAETRGGRQETQRQEKERKERLQSRAQLRDEAWGSDGE